MDLLGRILTLELWSLTRYVPGYRAEKRNLYLFGPELSQWKYFRPIVKNTRAALLTKAQLELSDCKKKHD